MAERKTPLGRRKARRLERRRVRAVQIDSANTSSGSVDNTQPFLFFLFRALGVTASCNSIEIRSTSLSAIRRRLRAASLKSHVAARKPLLTSEHRRKRLDFVRQHEHWRAEDWQQVIFSDESTLTSCWNQRLRVWRVRGSRYEHEDIRSVGASGRVSVNVWGAITYAGLGQLFRIPGRLTVEVYNEIIDDVLLPFAINGPFPDGCFYFQRDGFPVHNASTVQKNLNASGIAQLCWPPKSPDLNIIENVWGLMKAQLARANLTNNHVDSLWKHVEMEWNALRQVPDLVKSLFDSIPKRLNDV
ncbi:hypothetical protein MRX96_044771 [Rhipicephalus microplus]